MFKTTDNENYAATVVKINQLEDIPNADNLKKVSCMGFTTIVHKDYFKVGDLVLLFSSGTKLSQTYTKYNNLYKKAKYNKDKTSIGYIDTNRLVKAIKLRNVISSCMLMPLDSLKVFKDVTDEDIANLKEWQMFNTVNGHNLCSKYSNFSASNDNSDYFIKSSFFTKHFYTPLFFKNPKEIYKNDKPTPVIITQKLHGTSARFGKILMPKKLKWYERLAQKLGIRVKNDKLVLLCGSKTAIKNNAENNYYDKNIWFEMMNKISNKIEPNTIIFGELIGWIDDRPIQNNYTYQIKEGGTELYVYRIIRNVHGQKTELSWEAVKEYCEKYNLKHVPELAIKCFSDVDSLVNFVKTQFLDVNLSSKYESAVPIDKDCPCDEGVCLRVEGLEPRIFKAKSPMFYIHESTELEKGIVNIEDAEATEIL